MVTDKDRRRLGEDHIDEQQLSLLRKCIEAGDASRWNEWRRANPDAEIWLQGANLVSGGQKPVLRRINLRDANLARARLGGAVLVGADLSGAVLVGAGLGEAILVDASLRNAQLHESDLRGANLRGCDLRGAQCTYARVGAETLLLTDRVDEETDFTGVPLDDMRIEPGLRQVLEYNVRRERWHQWYRSHPVLAGPAWLFWQMCDYGNSTWRILASFTVLALAFAIAYRAFPQAVVAVWAERPAEPLSFGYSLYFSIVTMTTLGFGDVYAAPDSGLGQFLLSFQVMLGYILLGALVTRFAVLFTAGGPSASFFREERSEEREPGTRL